MSWWNIYMPVRAAVFVRQLVLSTRLGHSWKSASPRVWSIHKQQVLCYSQVTDVKQESDSIQRDGKSGIKKQINLLKSNIFDETDDEVKHNLVEYSKRKFLLSLSDSSSLEITDSDMEKISSDYKELEIDPKYGQLNHSDILKASVFLLEEKQFDLQLTVNVERTLLDSLDKMNTSDLFQVLISHDQVTDIPYIKEVFDKTLAILMYRISDIHGQREVTYLLSKANTTESSNAFAEKLLKFVDTMSLEQLYEVLYMLARNQRRHPTLLRSVCNHMKSEELKNLGAEELANIVFSFAKLNFTHAPLLTDVSNVLVKKTDSISGAVAYSLMKSVKVLRLKDQELLRSLVRVILYRAENSLYVTSAITTCASVGILPENLEDCLTSLVHSMKELEVSNPDIWLNTVWSLCVLGVCSSKVAETVLKEEFRAKLLSGEESKIKLYDTLLRNIKASTVLDMKDFSGTEFTFAESFQPITKKPSLLKESVWDTLHSIYRDKKNIVRDLATNEGYTIDFALLLNQDGEIQPFDATNEVHGLKKIAVLVIDFDGFTRGKLDLVGRWSMAVRHLEKLGYEVVQMNYNEYPLRLLSLEKETFVRRKIKLAIDISNV